MIVYFVAIVVAALGFVFTVITSGGALRPYLDIPAVIITVLVPFVYQWLIFGGAAVKKAFAAGFSKDVSFEEIKKAQFFFKTYAKTLWISSMIAALTGAIAILVFLEDKTALGPNFALAMMSLLYTGFIQLVIIIPNSVFLKKRLLTFTKDF